MIIDCPVYAPQSTLPVTGEEGQTCFIAGVGPYIYINGAWVFEIGGGEGGSGPSSTDALPEGSTNKYFLPARVLAAPLTGYVVGSNAAVAATDTVSEGFGKVQAQINAAVADIAAVASDVADIEIPASEPPITGGTNAQYLRGDKTFVDLESTVKAFQLTGISLASAVPVAATDTQLVATGKLQAQHDQIVKVAAVSASAIDCAAGSYFTKTITGATTFTVANVLASGICTSIMLELTNGGAQTVNWFSGVTWAGGTAPTLTASGVDVLGFYTLNGGTTWRGFLMAKDIK